LNSNPSLLYKLLRTNACMPHLFLFLANTKIFLEEHFKELFSLIDELEVWRGYEKPPSLYKDILIKSKGPLKHIRADIEKYLEGS